MTSSPGLPRMTGLAAALVLSSGMTQAIQVEKTNPLLDDLQHSLKVLSARSTPGLLGISVVDLKTGRTAGIEANRSFPMMSDFKVPIAAAVLSRVDDHRLLLQQRVLVSPSDAVPGSAVPSIGSRLRAHALIVTVGELLEAAVSQSDNTAADILLKLAGGPTGATRYLRMNGVDGMTITNGEAGIARQFANLHGRNTPPAGETTEQRNRRLRDGYAAFLAAPANQTTPNASALFLTKLWNNELLSNSSTSYLLDLMYAQTTPSRLRGGLPPFLRLADKTGTSGAVDGMTAAYNDMGIFVRPDGHALVVVALLEASGMSTSEKDALFADLARDATKLLR